MISKESKCHAAFYRNCEKDPKTDSQNKTDHFETEGENTYSYVTPPLYRVR